MVSAAEDAVDLVAWYANDGTGLFGPSQPLLQYPSVESATSVHAADLDPVAASSGDDSVSWFENLGAGAFGPRQTITAEADDAQVVRSWDADGDGDLDVFVASFGDDTVAWYENLRNTPPPMPPTDTGTAGPPNDTASEGSTPTEEPGEELEDQPKTAPPEASGRGCTQGPSSLGGWWLVLWMGLWGRTCDSPWSRRRWRVAGSTS